MEFPVDQIIGKGSDAISGWAEWDLPDLAHPEFWSSV